MLNKLKIREKKRKRKSIAQLDDSQLEPNWIEDYQIHSEIDQF